jgi:YbbR domain-containing protein
VAVNYSRFIKFITNNWGSKIFALAAAVLMWSSLMGEEAAEMNMKIPLELHNVPKGMMVGNEVITDLDVRIFGNQRRLYMATNHPIAKILDLSGLNEGEHLFILRPEDFELPAGVQAIRVSPSTLSINLTRTVTNNVTVRPVLHGAPADGYVVEDTIFTPSKVKVMGTARDMDNLDWVWTVPIDINEQSSTFTVQARLRWPAGQIVQMEPSVVSAQIVLKPVKTNTENDAPAPPAASAPNAN